MQGNNPKVKDKILWNYHEFFWKIKFVVTVEKGFSTVCANLVLVNAKTKRRGDKGLISIYYHALSSYLFTLLSPQPSHSCLWSLSVAYRFINMF